MSFLGKKFITVKIGLTYLKYSQKHQKNTLRARAKIGLLLIPIKPPRWQISVHSKNDSDCLKNNHAYFQAKESTNFTIHKTKFKPTDTARNRHIYFFLSLVKIIGK